MKKALVKYSKPKAFLSKARVLGKNIVKKGIKFGGIGAALGIGAYAAGASSRRYAKAPKPGEGRNLGNTVLAKPDKRTYYL
tara:strand:- start:772 stop:1014 length:243 start_codon:yes stop_codon:yes gene_type:complete